MTLLFVGDELFTLTTFFVRSLIFVCFSVARFLSTLPGKNQPSADTLTIIMFQKYYLKRLAPDCHQTNKYLYHAETMCVVFLLAALCSEQ